MVWRGLLLAAAFLLGGFLSTGPVVAEEPVPELVLEVPPGSSVGDQVTINALLLDPEGNPVAGEVVTFTTAAKFLNTSGPAELGWAITDENGRASLNHTFTRDGELSIAAQFSGSRSLAPAETSISLQVGPGPQLFNEKSPFRIPGANIWIVVAVLATIWTVYLEVMGLLWLISRHGAAQDPMGGMSDE